MYQLVLASESPRRRQILETAGFAFNVVPVKVSEIPDKNLNIDMQILDIARRKAKAAFALTKQRSNHPFLLLAADTMVVYHNKAIGKPSNSNEAFEFLKLLSRNVHEVKTGLIVIESTHGHEVSHVETSQVYFRHLSEDEIWTYIQSGEPMDKAGAYAIQGLGGAFVEKFVGDYQNIVGLPLKAFENILLQQRWQVKKS